MIGSVITSFCMASSSSVPRSRSDFGNQCLSLVLRADFTETVKRFR
jgi:hypothetical protein